MGSNLAFGTPVVPLPFVCLINVACFIFTAPRPPSKWEYDRKLGVGAFGVVHQCHDVESGRILAVKEVNIDDNNPKANKVNYTFFQISYISSDL